MSEEMARAAALPQADASSLVDARELEEKVKEMYGQVAREEVADLHFEVGRELAEHLGYPAALLDRIPPEAVASFAGVGYHLDLASLADGEAVLDLGSGSGTDAGVDFTREQIAKAQRLRDRDGISQARFVEGRIDDLPFDNGTFDAVISNGVINLSVDKTRVFSDASRVLRPGGRLVIADIVSGRALKERTRRNVDLWAACIGGAIPRASYFEAIDAAGFAVQDVRRNDYRFVSDRALEACSTYAVQSVSLMAVKVA
jgi:arsenite methyltransferase